MAEEVINSCLNLMRRMPPADVEKNLAGLVDLQPDYTDEILQRVDQPLQEQTDPDNGKQYILCDYNREADSFRSPWSNKFVPPLDAADADEVPVPEGTLRELEVEANELFDVYRELYFEGGVSSVYCWDLDGGAFAACWLIKKDVPSSARHVDVGSWNSIHVFSVHPEGDKFKYKLTSTVALSMVVSSDKAGSVDLSGSLTRQSAQTLGLAAGQGHASNMGGMVERMENDFRSTLDTVYMAKTQDVFANLRTKHRAPAGSADFFQSLNSAVLKRRAST